jgi:hypothetical protein
MPDDMPMSTEVAAEPPERAVGDGCGVLVTARTTGGCVFGASGAPALPPCSYLAACSLPTRPGVESSRCCRGAICTRRRASSEKARATKARLILESSLLRGAGLGQRGVSAEDVGQRAAAELMDALGSGACCDEWLQDQLVVFMALAKVRKRLRAGGWAVVWGPTSHACPTTHQGQGGSGGRAVQRLRMSRCLHALTIAWHRGGWV